MEKSHGFAVFWALLLIIGACDSRIKEHPLPPELKRQLDMKNNPALQAKAISGKLTADAKLVQSVPGNTTLFVFLRAKGVEDGPPLAVKRLSDIKFPYEYQIGPWDIMMPGAKFEGDLTLTARLDQDGDAKASPGDVEGSREVKPGDKNADLVLDRAVPGVPAGGQSISGLITVDPKLAQNLPDNMTLFIFARAKGVKSGPPMAVKRLTGVKFPYQYKIGQDDVMMPGVPFGGEVTLTARLDKDGNAKASSGDIEGTLDTVAGKDKVGIMLDQVLP
jgi:hypothetical protein